MKLSEIKNYTIVGSFPSKRDNKEESKKGLGQKILDAGSSVAKFVGAEGISEQFGANIASARAKNPAEKRAIQFPSQKKVIGSAIQTGANLIPGAGKGVGLVGKALVGGATGYAFDIGSKLQKGESTADTLKPGVGTALGLGLPVAGAVVRPALRIVTRLLKGLGSGVSGVSVKNIESILNNPEKAQKISEQIGKTGSAKVLESEARTILNGVSKIKQEARKAFGEGLQQLSEVDVDPKVFRSVTQDFLDGFGISGGKNLREFAGIEFDDPKNVRKASELLDKLANVDLDGRSLRKLADDIESSAYKIATSDERLSFNAFIGDLSSNLRRAITQSTPKLDEINAKFSNDIQLAEATENIFGKVKFKNLAEILKASQKLETLFSQKGLAPEVVDDFLTRIGVSPDDFKTSEAVRQISDKVSGSNTKGLSLGEVIQQVTGTIVTPQVVKNISIYAGLSEKQLIPLLQAMSKPARNTVINALLLESQGSQR